MPATEAPEKPVPEPDNLSEPFFEGAREGRLMIQRCSTCESFVQAGSAVCAECLSEDLEWVQAAGTGTVFTFGVMHQLYHPGFAPDIPYVVAVIELDEGPRINSNVVGCPPGDVRVGDRVTAIFEEAGAELRLPKFKRVEGH